jgi:DNA-binding NarL/FixJ family response regulator
VVEVTDPTYAERAIAEYRAFLAHKECAPKPWEPPPLGPSFVEFREEHGIDGPTHYIYGLHDPRNDELRYIGKSDRPRERLSNHLQDKSNNHRCHWLQELKQLGLRPVLVIIDAVPAGHGWQHIEQVYIAAAREAGHRLTNATDGGDGVVNLTPEARAKMRATWLGRKHRPESLERISAASRGCRHTDDWRAYMRERMRSRTFSDDHRQKISRALQKLTDEQVREIRRLLADGVSQYVIADRFGIHQGSVSNIARGHTYREVTP